MANQLISKGFTLGKLKQISKQNLNELGLSLESIELILSESRPPIPEIVARKILFESKYTCCICRDSSKSIIIHHIVPWEESRSHAEENLVVLCLEHHDKAHSKHELSLNLTTERIRDAKQKWIQTIKEKDVETILNIHNTDGAFYDYFNMGRVYELVDNLKINPTESKYYRYALQHGFINAEGLVLPLENWSKTRIEEKDYWLDFFEGTYLYHYLKTLFLMIINKKHFIRLNRIWNRKAITSVIKPGDFILIQGVFYFRSKTNKVKGNQQIKLGYRKAKGIKVEFEFDVFYCNSDSSRSHLSGRSVKTVYCLVRSIKIDGEFLVLTCSALALGTGFNRPDYFSTYYSHCYVEDDECDYDDNCFDDESEDEIV
ncbi:HNH endonuclease signature motif containing protein [Paenibacillus elgii]|uniref:HNH endonuclease signature motif containing protein n=1 Tax=Paenibacillus elgii TaxID=189691 RepID=UPI0013D55685|nr:HNH endonuclease signature motif containing protein [Paenibacillus elgii]NEN81265.1 HNH endonuclease [Paenibacillus elgii]